LQAFQRMSEAEREIMEILWRSSRPVTTTEIMERLPQEKHWKVNTVITFLARLTQKGLVKSTRIGKANHYEPRVTEREYRNFETRRFIRDVHQGSVLGLISTLCDSGDLTKEDIEKLMKKLEQQGGGHGDPDRE